MLENKLEEILLPRFVDLPGGAEGEDTIEEYESWDVKHVLEFALGVVVEFEVDSQTKEEDDGDSHPSKPKPGYEHSLWGKISDKGRRGRLLKRII